MKLSYLLFVGMIFSLITSTSNAQLTVSPSQGGEVPLQSGNNTITITNTGASVTPAINLSQPGVSITINRCSSVLAKNKSCNVTVNVAEKNLPSGVTLISLKNGVEPLVNLKYEKLSVVSLAPEFTQSSISITDFTQQIISIVNKSNSTKSFTPSFSGVDASKFLIILNRCSNVSPNQECSIILKLSPQSAGTYSASLTDPQITSPLSISSTILSNTAGVIQPQVNTLSVSSNSIDFGTLTKIGLSASQVLTITNTGNTSLSPVITLSPNIQSLLNRCSSINPSQSCTVTVGLRTTSGMSSGPILGESILVKKDAQDSGSSVIVIATLTVGPVVPTCNLGEHLESSICVSDTRSCNISNGSGTQTWSGSWSACQNVTCVEDYYVDVSGIACNQITYAPQYSNYSPLVPSSMNICDGTLVSVRTLDNCLMAHDPVSVLFSKCQQFDPDMQSTITSLSPNGNIFLSIANGEETFSCAEGSSQQMFSSRSCNSGYSDSGLGCNLITYTPTFSSYSPEIPVGMTACDGTETSNRSIISCVRDDNSQSVSTSFCSDPQPQVTSLSPSGDVIQLISNGSETSTCSLGSVIQTFSHRSCDSGFADSGSECIVAEETFKVIPEYFSSSVCTISLYSEAYCWGAGADGQLGRGSSSDINFPSQISMAGAISGKNIDSIHQSSTTTCVIGDDRNAYCWGLGTSGQLGNGSSATSTVPVAVSKAGVLSGKTIKKLEMSPTGTCVIASDDKVYCWGTGTSGQLGNASSSNSNIPVAVNTSGVLSGKTIKDLRLSSTHACVIASDDNAYCWGTGTSGQLGHGSSPTSSNVPVAVSKTGVLSGKTIKKIETSNTTCAIASDDNLYCWGLGTSGQLGHGLTSNSNVPVAVSTSGVLSGKTIKKVSVKNTVCAIASDDNLYCWGLGTSGQLGNGSITTSNIPVAVSKSGVLSGKTIKSLVVGNSACAIASDDNAYCWGLGTVGQLGNATILTSSIPVAVDKTGELRGKTIKTISSGNNGQTFCSIASDNTAYCWGLGTSGQLGHGSSSSSNVPVAVDYSAF